MREKEYIIKYKKTIKLIWTFTIIMVLLHISSYAAMPKMVNKMYDAFNKIQKYTTRISTPIAGAAIGTGLLMRKFSFGEEERIRKSKKIIRDTIVAYSLILCLDLLISFIETLAG